SYDPQTPQHSHESPKPLPRTPISNRSRSSSASLPSPSFLFSPTRQKSSSHRTPSHLTTTTTPPTPSHQPLSPARHSKKAKELIAVRESLPGAWKDVPSWEVKAGVVRERNVFQEVEVLDLTSE
ncbi:hypothetical protein MMC12_007016, partial [Toensbergia leucococca]|nr:hypothetical protein [Toensbergia leucococca]